MLTWRRDACSESLERGQGRCEVTAAGVYATGRDKEIGGGVELSMRWMFGFGSEARGLA
jgi:hypothetical protein